MAKRPAGKRYPHATTAARPHDHRWCPVAGAIAQRAVDGKEQWGVLHEFPPVGDEETAADIKRGFYRARSCKELRAEGLPAISIQAGYEHLDDGTYRPWLRVFDRNQARHEIVRRVQSGEPLAYNVLRSSA